jgi:hypothetical protein
MFGGPPRTSRQTVDDLPVIDVHRLRREGVIRPGATTVTLAINGVRQTIRLALRPGSLGGEVALLYCPACHSKRWHLYVRDGAIGCRGCLRLGWSRHWCRSGSVVSRIRRLRRKLGASLVPLSPLPPRAPRRGRAALRYDRLAREIAAAECMVLAALARTIAATERLGLAR